MRLGTLHTNNLTNADVKYEILEDMIIHNVIAKEKKELWMRDFLLRVKYEGVKLFTNTEYRGGKYSKDIIVIVNPCTKLITHKWIAQEYGKKVTIKRETEYKTSSSPY